MHESNFAYIIFTLSVTLVAVFSYFFARLYLLPKSIAYRKQYETSTQREHYETSTHREQKSQIIKHTNRPELLETSPTVTVNHFVDGIAGLERSARSFGLRGIHGAGPGLQHPGGSRKPTHAGSGLGRFAR